MLRIPYECIGASDPDAECQTFIKANFAPLHLHKDMVEQASSSACLMHGDAGSCLSHRFASIDFFHLGTSCPPFSKHRAKRFADGSVAGHKDTATTKQVVAWLQAFEPQAGCLEQVAGFGMAESEEDTTSPLERLVAVFCRA